MIKLSQKLDEDAIESLEYDIATVLMKARHKTGLIQTWLNYYQLENFPAQRSTTPYVMRCTIWHNLTQLAQFRKRKKHPQRSVTFSKVAGFMVQNRATHHNYEHAKLLDL